MKKKEIALKLLYWVVFWFIVQTTDWKTIDWYSPEFLSSTIIICVMVVFFRNYYDWAGNETKKKRKRAK